MAWLDRFLVWTRKRPEQVRTLQVAKGHAAAGGEASNPHVLTSDKPLFPSTVSNAKSASAIIDRAKNEAQNIIARAEQTAAAIQIEAKKRAFEFLVQETQAVENEVAREYKSALSRLSESLQLLSAESLKIDDELKRKMAALAANRSCMLQEARTALLGSGAESAPQKKLQPPARTGTAADSMGNVLPPTPSFETEAIEPCQNPEPVSLKTDANGKPQAHPAQKRKFFSINVRVPGKNGRLPPSADSGVEISAPNAHSVTTDIPVVQHPAGQDSDVEAVSTVQERREKTAVQSEAPPLLLPVDEKAPYSGEVELMIVPPVDLKLITRFYNYLQTVPELKVLYTKGSWNQGTTIVVVLEKPFALLKTITAAPDISVTAGMLENDPAAGGKTIALLRRKDGTTKRLGLVLENSDGSSAANPAG